MNTKNNQRFQETGRRIEQALFTLLTRRDIRQVSVRELCEESGVNRSTFYAHYLDIYDLLEKAGRGWMEGLLQSLRSDVEWDAPHFFIPRGPLIRMLCYVRENRGFCEAYLRHYPAAEREGGFARLWEGTSRPYLQALGMRDERQMWYRFLFFRAGFTAILQEWVQMGCREPPELLAELILSAEPGRESSACEK